MIDINSTSCYYCCTNTTNIKYTNTIYFLQWHYISVATNTTTISPERVQPIIPEGVQQILPQTLSRLSAGLPKHELDIIIKEARACEDGL